MDYFLRSFTRIRTPSVKHSDIGNERCRVGRLEVRVIDENQEIACGRFELYNEIFRRIGFVQIGRLIRDSCQGQIHSTRPVRGRGKLQERQIIRMNDPCVVSGIGSKVEETIVWNSGDLRRQYLASVGIDVVHKRSGKSKIRDGYVFESNNRPRGYCQEWCIRKCKDVNHESACGPHHRTCVEGFIAIRPHNHLEGTMPVKCRHNRKSTDLRPEHSVVSYQLCSVYHIRSSGVTLQNRVIAQLDVDEVSHVLASIYIRRV
mmetsp:Transcript_33718/g.52492  ORF Transcript_33718/g.52492 Transcript_33718/m.52492 type:complete len:260 (-) Transcript_33718:3283-4062(-)